MILSYLTAQPIDTQKLTEVMTSDDFAGGSVVFLGKIRNNPSGKQVDRLIYESYEMLAEKTIAELIATARSRWPVRDIYVRHRLGTLSVGDIAVAIVVLSAHRDEAYQASRFLIDAIKHTVPIWKKEFFTDGTSQWGRCSHASGEEDPVLRPLQHAGFTAVTSGAGSFHD